MKFAKNKHKNQRRKHSQEPGSMSAKADRHKLYELSVQDVSHEYSFINKTFREIRGYNAHLLREDFCGTAKMCCEWVSKRDKNTAVGVDIDPEVLGWGKKTQSSQVKVRSQETHHPAAGKCHEGQIKTCTGYPGDEFQLSVVQAKGHAEKVFQKCAEVTGK